jgi:hypothetical protein
MGLAINDALGDALGSPKSTTYISPSAKQYL